MELIRNNDIDGPATTHDAVIRGAVTGGFSLVPVTAEGRAVEGWGPRQRAEAGRDMDILGSYAQAKWQFAVDWHALGCVVTVGDGVPVEAPVASWEYEGATYAAYRGEHPGNRRWLADGAKGKFVARSKLIPIDPAILNGGLNDAEPVDFNRILLPKGVRAPAKPRASRISRLMALQKDTEALLERMFPGCEHRAEGDGWRVSTNGMTDNVAANPVGARGELMFKDFGEPASFTPGDALAVMKQLGVSGNEPSRSSVSGNESVGNEDVVNEPVAFRPATKSEKDDMSRAAQRIYRGALGFDDEDDDCSDALAYLEGRGVQAPPGAMLRYEPDCPFGKGIEKPCLVAGVTEDMEPGKPKDVAAIQRIALDGSGKKTLGKVQGAVNVSGEPLSGSVGVAEGVVTALAAQSRFRIPFVASLGTGNLKHLTFNENVDHVTIAADNDEAGQGVRAAKALARKLRAKDVNVRIVMPEKDGADFADTDCGDDVDVPLDSALVEPKGELTDLLGGTEARGESLFAHEFLERHRSRFRHDARFGEHKGAWVEWNGVRWTRRATPPRTAVGSIIRELCEGNEKDTKSFDKSGVKTGVLQLVAEHCARDAWDESPSLVGLPGGLVMDLDTGDVRQQERDDYITRSASVVPAEDAGEFPALVLDLCGGDESLYEWCRSLAVDCATGKAGKDLFPIVHGPPGTGKSTVWNAVHRVLGSYAGSVLSKHLLVARNQPHLSWLAGLVDKRMVLTSEVPPGMTWDGPLVSMLTGGDAVTANFMRKDHFEFVPKFRFMALVNDVPALPSDNSGLRRRVRILTFDQVRGGRGVGEDDSIREYYCDDAEGQAQVFRWVADAAREVNGRDREFRYPYCARIEADTNEYLDERDDFSTWFDAAVKPGDGAFHTTAAHEEYNEWAGRFSAMRLSRDAIGTELAKRLGCKSSKVSVDGQRGMGFRGYTLASRVEARPERKRLPKW